MSIGRVYKSKLGVVYLPRLYLDLGQLHMSLTDRAVSIINRMYHIVFRVRTSDDTSSISRARIRQLSGSAYASKAFRSVQNRDSARFTFS
jgi:hypothetical protein